MDEFSQKRLDKVLAALKDQNSRALTKPEVDELIESAVDAVREELWNYYTEQYDPDEPGVAAFNLISVIDDLKAVAKGDKIL